MKKKRRKTDNELTRWQRMWKAVKMELHQNKSSFTVYVILRALVILVMIRQLLNQNYEYVFLCILVLLLFIIPSFIQVNFKIELPTTLEIIILLFIFAAEILGEISEFYVYFPFWDTMLHTLNGFLAAAIGFSLVMLLNDDERVAFRLSPFFLALVAFCFSMTIGVIWEFFECGVDLLFGLDMQKDTIIHTISSITLDPAGGNRPYAIHDITSTVVNGKDLGINGYLDIGLLDTMEDLLVNFIGALIFSVIGFFYVKHRGKGSFVTRFIPRRKRRENDYLAIIEQEAAETSGSRDIPDSGSPQVLSNNS